MENNLYNDGIKNALVAINNSKDKKETAKTLEARHRDLKDEYSKGIFAAANQFLKVQKTLC